MLYRKRVFELEAVQFLKRNEDGRGVHWGEDTLPGWLRDAFAKAEKSGPAGVEGGMWFNAKDELYVGTAEGAHMASPGDWIVCGIKGELYPVKPHIFAELYEPVK